MRLLIALSAMLCKQGQEGYAKAEALSPFASQRATGLRAHVGDGRVVGNEFALGRYCRANDVIQILS